MYMREKNISEDRKKYLRKIKINKISVIVTQISILLIFIIGWEILANAGIIDSFITSSPSRVLETFLNLSSNRTLTSPWSNTNWNVNRLHRRCSIRSRHCYHAMVVKLFSKSIRAIFSSTKQLAKSSTPDQSSSYG